MRAFDVRNTPGVLHLSGEIDLAAAPPVVAAGTAALAAGSSLVIDLGAVTFLDSSAIGALVALRSLAADEGKSLTLVDVSDRVRRIFDITGLSDVFEIRSARSGQATA